MDDLNISTTAVNTKKTNDKKVLKGLIHSFESFGTVDGPGIRFVVFMQGCHLKCKYCHNRDTWATCGGTWYTEDELLAKIMRYKNYFMPSGGGVTISGGEPLLQLKFLLSLFPKLKRKSIHIAVDTSGSFDLTEEMKQLIDVTDLFLLDIKCINDEICKWLTGTSNKQELEFAKYLSSIKKPMWIRQVLIPDITDKQEDLENLKNFIYSLNSVEKIEILPYHDMGQYKWEKLGISYPLKNVRPATLNDLERAKRILEIR